MMEKSKSQELLDYMDKKKKTEEIKEETQLLIHNIMINYKGFSIAFWVLNTLQIISGLIVMVFIESKIIEGENILNLTVGNILISSVFITFRLMMGIILVFSLYEKRKRENGGNE